MVPYAPIDLTFPVLVWEHCGGAYGEYAGEVRILPGGSSQFFQYHTANTAKYRPGLEDAYFGVLPRKRPDWRTVSPETTRVLWADVDAKKFDYKQTDIMAAKGEAYKGLTSYPISPSVIVDSGRGYHGYWFLAEDAPWEEARAAMKEIARRVRGDAVSDASRILRIPGTINSRSGTRAQVVHQNIIPIPFAQLRVTTPPPVQITAAAVNPNPPTGYLAASLIERMKLPTERGHRSDEAYSVAVRLLRAGLSWEEVEQTFAAFPQGVGEKYAEKGPLGHSWLQYVLAAASREAYRVKV